MGDNKYASLMRPAGRYYSAIKVNVYEVEAAAEEEDDDSSLSRYCDYLNSSLAINLFLEFLLLKISGVNPRRPTDPLQSLGFCAPSHRTIAARFFNANSEVGALHSSTLSFTEEHMAENVKVHGDGSAELVKSMGDNKYASLMRPAGRYYSAIKDATVCGKGRYTLVKDVDDVENGAYDKPLPCFGCGIGWFSFLMGFVFPFLWYYSTFLYFGNYYRKDPRERAGLAASAITAMGFSLLLLVIVAFRCVLEEYYKMNKRFGGKIPTGTPSLALSTIVVVASLLGGASIVHNLYKPNLRLPQMENDEPDKKKESGNKD
ncbi:unnamed protein product [Brassica rapa subsp. trilocularis]